MKRLSLITEFDEYYKGSDLQKIVNGSPLPIKYTINGSECYFYNADLFGLFDWKLKKDGLTTNDFINDYKNGFIKGLEHLKKVEKIKIKDIKNANSRSNTILQIQNILFEREFQFGSKGLINLVFKKLPLIFTEKNIYEWGYWNGIIHSIENLCNITGLNKNGLEILPPQQPEAVNSDEILKNEFDKIFKNDIGFTIFTKMFEIYKDNKNKLANFSFLFFVMEKDFLICSQTDFVKFLENDKYDVNISKIDNRQWYLDMNQNNKTKLFNSIKDRYQSNTIKAQ